MNANDYAVWVTAIVTNALVALWLVASNVMWRPSDLGGGYFGLVLVIPPITAVVSHIWPPQERGRGSLA